MTVGLEGADKQPLSVRGQPSEDHLVPGGGEPLVGEDAAVHCLVGVRQAQTSGYGCYGSGIVARHDLYLDAFLPEPFQRVGGRRADGIPQQEVAQRPRYRRQLVLLERSSGLGQGQDPEALRRPELCGGGDRFQYERGSAQNQDRPVCKGGGGFFSGGGEGENRSRDFLPRRQGGGERPQGPGTGFKGAQEAGSGGLQLRLVRVCRLCSFQSHLSGGQGSGLVQAQNVNSSQGFDSEELLHQGFAAAKLYHAGHQRHRGQQDQPLGDHADHGGYGRRHRLLDGYAPGPEFPDKEQQAQRYQQMTDPANQSVEVGHQLRFRGFDPAGVAHEAGGVAVVAYGGQLSCDLALGQEGTGHEPVSGRPPDGIALTGQQGFIRGAGAVANDGVGGKLISGPEDDQVPQNQIGGRTVGFDAVADRMAGLLLQQPQLVQHGPGPQRLDRSDQRIGENHAQKQHVPPGAHQGQAEGEGEVQQIEEGKEIFPNDLEYGLAGLSALPIGLSGLRSSRSLCCAQSCLRGWNEMLRQPGGQSQTPFCSGFSGVLLLLGSLTHRPSSFSDPFVGVNR